MITLAAALVDKKSSQNTINYNTGNQTQHIRTPTLSAMMIHQTVSAIDDDASTSSTVSVSRTAEEKPLGSVTRKKSVQINESANQYVENEDFCLYEDDIRNVWYSCDDMHCFKEQYVKDVREIIRLERITEDSPGSYFDSMNQIFKACCAEEEDITKAQQNIFRLWTEVSIARLGLERASNRRLAHEKADRQEQLILTIMDIQFAYDERELYPDPEVIAEACQSISRASRRFAHHLAVARAKSQVE